MIFEVELAIIADGKTEKARLVCDNAPGSITLVMSNAASKTYSETNFYRCFGLLRADNPKIKFLCKGSKVNVHPSSMSSQMSQGLKAYELTLGKRPSSEDVIDIFDYDDTNLTNDPEEQRSFYLKWIQSEKG